MGIFGSFFSRKPKFSGPAAQDLYTRIQNARKSGLAEIISIVKSKTVAKKVANGHSWDQGILPKLKVDLDSFDNYLRAQEQVAPTLYEQRDLIDRIKKISETVTLHTRICSEDIQAVARIIDTIDSNLASELQSSWAHTINELVSLRDYCTAEHKRLLSLREPKLKEAA